MDIKTPIATLHPNEMRVGNFNSYPKNFFKPIAIIIIIGLILYFVNSYYKKKNESK